jgi:cellulose synthase/poly-beta-1,6-N-acetylglucosamine synthase-like glycosyltransferase
MIETLIKLLPHILTLFLLFLPDIIYKLSVKKNVENLLKDNGIEGHTPKSKLESQIKSNFDFVAFSTSSISLVYSVLYSLKLNESGVYQLPKGSYLFLAIFILLWFLLLLISKVFLNKGEQPGFWQKLLVLIALGFSVYMSLV